MASPRDAAARKLIDRLVPDPADGTIMGLLSTSYEFDAEFFETDFLPSALGLGAWSDRRWSSRIALERDLATMSSATVLLDARRYRRRPRSLRVETTPVALPQGRALHAKVTLLVHERAVRLLLGSANLTQQGYRKNREVAVALGASARNPAHATLLRDAITAMPTVFAPWWTASAARVTRDALDLLGDWASPASEDDSWFAWSGAGAPALWQQFVSRWPQGEPIERITVVSPFWSRDAAEGPVRALLVALEQVSSMRGARLRLLTEAKPDGPRTWRPVLPESYGECRLDDMGIEATAEAVDPVASDADVDARDAIGGLRPLHAKVLLVQGPTTSLAYVGSGNFTRRGWGFLPDPGGANIEAGLVVRRTGKSRESLAMLLPPTVGRPVPLDGAATGKLALPEPEQPELAWPSFVREVVLASSGTDVAQLHLEVRLAPEEVRGAWRIELMESAGQIPTLASSEDDTPHSAKRVVPLAPATLEVLLQQQEVRVTWWGNAEGRAFPLNVDGAARDGLPIAPGAGRPGEDHLVAYYQGRISWDDLFPEPDDEMGGGGAPGPNGEPSGVDTARIQAYQIREFVEALRGITDDLRTASSSLGAMRLALHGPVSPVALAREVLAAAVQGKRTPIAAGFQLLEILSCVAQARAFTVSERYRAEWTQLVRDAEREVAAVLTQLRSQAGHALSGIDSFMRYERTITNFCRAQRVGS